MKRPSAMGLALDPDRSDLHLNYARMLKPMDAAGVDRALDAGARDRSGLGSPAPPEPVRPYFELGDRRTRPPMLSALAGNRTRTTRRSNIFLPRSVRHETPSRAADDYVAEVFDEFAETFDRKLAMLNYRAPQMVANALGRRWLQYSPRHPTSSMPAVEPACVAR